MSQQQPPAGWYDDPAGGGGRRYWNGNAWTQQVQAGGGGHTTPRTSPSAARTSAARASSARGRVPEGYMLLNGKQVPLGQMSTPQAPRQGRGLLTALIVTAAVVAVIFGLGAALVTNIDDNRPDVDYFLEVESDTGGDLDIRWLEDGEWFEDSGVGSDWRLGLENPPNGTVLYVQARPVDYDDRVTCRVTDADGEILAEQTAAFPGGLAMCRYTVVESGKAV